jgi:hypothetical protein
MLNIRARRGKGMPFRSRSVGRELSAALAVLAIYALVLLAPLHQAAGLQQDLAERGYGSADSWSVCTAVTPDGQSELAG